jgi:hypothetical protein
MITKEVAAKIWNCYNEIDQAEKMIQTMKEGINKDAQMELKDNWGESHDSLELRIPSGRGSHFIRRVSAEVALTVITTHIEKQKEELNHLKGICRIQLS